MRADNILTMPRALSGTSSGQGPEQERSSITYVRRTTGDDSIQYFQSLCSTGFDAQSQHGGLPARSQRLPFLLARRSRLLALRAVAI